MRNPFRVLNCEAILKSGGGSRVLVAAIEETEKIVRFRAQKPHTGNDEGDISCFCDTLPCLIPCGIYTLLPPRCAQNVVITSKCFPIVRMESFTQEMIPIIAHLGVSAIGELESHDC